jgi:nucleotide-binding universal stress UspA family protein
MIKTILVPTDGSNHAVKAITFASDIASKYNARVVLFHSLLVGTSCGEILNLIEAGQLSDETMESLKQKADLGAQIKSTAIFASGNLPPSIEDLEHVGTEILKSGQRIATEHGVENVAKIMTNGEPIHCILRAMDEEGADLIVMGSRGLGDFEGLLVGSVSHKVSHLAECTVVTVK